MTLRRRLAEHGFESNLDFDYAVESLFAAPVEGLRCLHVDGAPGRRKTAFAQALVRALEFPRVVHHDFTAPEPPAPAVIVASDEDGSPLPAEAPPSAFERAMIEACAYSEGERVALVLDQLQAAPFPAQIRLQSFVRAGEWPLNQGSVRANPRNLLLLLVGDGPLYHPLARASFRVWVDARDARFDARPQDFGFGADAAGLFDALRALFEHLEQAPTEGEFRRIAVDLLGRVRTAEQLRQCLFGWMEGLDRERLYTPDTTPALDRVILALADYLGAEAIELRGS